MSSRKKALAQAASVRLVSAACAGEGEKWNRQEQLHADAGSQAKAWEAVAPLVKICAGCPIAAECRVWAAADNYTGIADTEEQKAHVKLDADYTKNVAGVEKKFEATGITATEGRLKLTITGGPAAR